MVLLKCCVVGCKATSESHRVFCFPKRDNLRNLWLSFLVPTNPLLLGLSKEQLRRKRVCEKHFDKYQFDAEGKRLRCSYPCLFTDEEIAQGVPLSSGESVLNALSDHNYYKMEIDEDNATNEMLVILRAVNKTIVTAKFTLGRSNQICKEEAMDTEMDDVLERAHFRSVVAAFKHYKTHTLLRINKSEKIISKLPENHQRRLEKYKSYLSKFRKCVEINNNIVQLIIKDVETMFENVNHGATDLSSGETNGNGEVMCIYDDRDFINGYDQLSIEKQHKVQHDVEKVQSVLKNLVRDWSEMGAVEREQCYKPIIDEIIEQFPPHECDPGTVKVLVPGAGLGRLAWEIATRGYTCQGNEFSLFMLFASNFILNKCPEVNQYEVVPWLHQYVNNLSCRHQTERARVPDVPPGTGSAADTRLSMAAGDFLKVYTEPNEWNCVATCFFIDCAPNVIEFIENIYNILQPGGMWINLGPLLYHYSDLTTEDSIEPPYDILLDIIKDVGFVILKERTGVKTKYAQNPNSMLQHEYDSVFFVCQKPSQ